MTAKSTPERMLQFLTNVRVWRACSNQIEDSQDGPAAQDEDEVDAKTLQSLEQYASLRMDLKHLASHLSLAPQMLLCAPS